MSDIEEARVIVIIDLISGQSFYADTIFNGGYSFIESDVLAENISSMLKTMGEPFDGVYIECEDEQVKLDIISGVVRGNKSLKLLKDANKPGANFGVNVYVTFPKKIEG